MRFLVTFLKATAAGVAALIAIVYILANHSSVQMELTCTGKWVQGGDSISGRAEAVYAVIELYRPWIIWANSDGNLRAESRDIPMVIYVTRVVTIGSPPLTLFSFSNHDDTSMVGGYRSGPREMTLEFSKGTVFSGNCEQGI